jgi:hypothetical protein
VPQPLVDEFCARLGPDRGPALADLLRLAELSKAQVHKLIESGICPGATGVVKPAWYIETGVKPCLQFFSRLPAALQARAQSPGGLPLREAPPELVERWLQTTLVAEAGAPSPELREDMVFSLGPGSRNPGLIPGYELALQTTRPRGPRWIRYVQPTTRPVVAPGATGATATPGAEAASDQRTVRGQEVAPRR